MTTTKITQKQLIQQSGIPKSLIRGVILQMGGWKSFTEAAPDICRHGIDGGFHGFIYNRDTEAFARRYRQDIQEMAAEQAGEFGTSVTEMIQSFGCFRHGTKPTDSEIGIALYAGKDDGAQVLNALAWYAGEEVCRAYCRLADPDNF